MAELVVRKRGKNWEYQFEIASVDGTRKRKTKSGFKTKGEAVKAGTKAKNEYDNTGMVFVPSSLSVSDYMDYFFEQYCKHELRYNSQEVYRQFITNYYKPYLGSYRLSCLTSVTIQDFIYSCKAKGLAMNTVKVIRVCLNKALDYAVNPCNFIQHNPAKSTKLPKFESEQTRPHHLISEEKWKLINERFPFGNKYHMMLLIGWAFGLRRGEISALTWDDFDFENNTLSVCNQIIKKSRTDRHCVFHLEEPKTRASIRTISFGEGVKEILLKERERQLINEKEYGDFYTIQILDNNSIVEYKKKFAPNMKRINMVCVDVNGKWNAPRSFGYCIRIIHQELGIDFDFHSLRVSNATHMLDKGADIKVVQSRLGHKNVNTTYDAYIRTTSKMITEGNDIVDKLLSTT